MIKIRFLLVLFLFVFSAIGQQFNFRNFNVEDGLGQSQVYAMCMENSGEIWMGTRGGGITVYDGIEFKTFTIQDGLTDNYINCFEKDKEGTIWIGTNNGVTYFDGKNFGQVTSSKGLNLVVRDFAIDGDGMLYAATNQGLYRITRDKSTLIKNTSELNLNAVEIRKGEFWYATNDGLYRSKPTLHACAEESKYMLNAITSITLDRKGNLWLGTYGDGMYCFDGYNYFRIDLHHELYRTTVLNVYTDTKDNLWISTLRNGVIQYDKSSKTFSTLNESHGLSNNHVRCVIQDHSLQFWFGTSGGGVCQFLGKQFANFDMRSGLAGSFIYSVFQDSKGNMWVGNSSKGVSLYKNGSFENFHAETGFANVKVKSIGEDSDGTIWFGTDGSGVWIYKNEEFTAIESLRGAYVKQITSDKKGNIWIATAGSGIIRVKAQNDNYIIDKWGYSDGILSSRVTALHFDKKGRLWYGTEAEGVGCFDPKIEKNILRFTAEEQNLIASNLIRSITEDKFGRLWVGTAGGGLSVIQMYTAQKKPWNVRRADGLNSENIYLLISDENGNIISGTEKGIDYIFFQGSGGIKQIKSYGNQDGFSGVETCQNSAFRDRYGSIWIGTINGLCRFNPSELTGNLSPPTLSFKDIKLFYESILNDHPTALENGIKGKPLQLGYNENHITFEFLGINLKRPDKVEYQWKLEGFDDKWSPVSKDRSIVYSNLNPGKYTFHLKASNGDGMWSKPISYSFVIATPYWETTWFKVLIGLSIVLILMLIYIISLRRIRKNARIRQREVEFEMDLLELEQKAMRLQMNPHFIFNALNSIQSLIGTGKETEARYFLAKFSRLMRQILDNSRKTSITMEEEIGTLENYLLIEKFCNGNRFNYEISVDPSLEPDFIQLPPMIVQPFVENAIKHGMRGIPEGTNSGRIKISFIDEKDVLKIVVEDNGIGREKAAELNRHSKETYHESTAMAVTTERLQLMKNQGIENPLEIVDLYENGEATGTQVIIRLPLD